jgi:hypothetical protein
VDPEDACDALRNVDLRGKVALIRRGNCNFTEKIFRVQQHHALAAVVYDSMDRERCVTRQQAGGRSIDFRGVGFICSSPPFP